MDIHGDTTGFVHDFNHVFLEKQNSGRFVSKTLPVTSEISRVLQAANLAQNALGSKSWMLIKFKLNTLTTVTWYILR